MKNVYSLVIVLLGFIAFLISQPVNAQCTCAGGIPATLLMNNVVLAPTNAPAATISVPKFDPSLNPGFDLSCVTLYDTLSGTTTSGARNLNSSTALLDPANLQYSPTGRMEYSFVLPVTANVIGPGFTQSHTWSTLYGPDSLGAYGQPDDTITYGPTNIFTNFVGSKVSTNVSAYVGSGTVSLSYNILGNLNATEGSINFEQKVTAVYSGNFGIAYYLCPSAPLASSIISFNAFKQNGSVQLLWLAASQQNNITYEIEYSTDESKWLAAGVVPAGSAPAGSVAQYSYQYNPASTDLGTLYFRIKKTDPAGNVVYSMIKWVDLNAGDVKPGIQIYPNPVVSNIVGIQFDQSQTGSFSLELVNTAGQVILQKQVNLNGSFFTNMELDRHPAKGLYFLRARQVGNNRQYLTKVLVN